MNLEVVENIYFRYLFHSCVHICVCAHVFIRYVRAYTCVLFLYLLSIHPTGKMQLTLPLGQTVRRNPIKFTFFKIMFSQHNSFCYFT